MPNIVHVVGTGTIGSADRPAADHREHFGIDEVTFHKRTLLVTERSKSTTRSAGSVWRSTPTSGRRWNPGHSPTRRWRR